MTSIADPPPWPLPAWMRESKVSPLAICEQLHAERTGRVLDLIDSLQKYNNRTDGIPALTKLYRELYGISERLDELEEQYQTKFTIAECRRLNQLELEYQKLNDIADELEEAKGIFDVNVN